VLSLSNNRLKDIHAVTSLRALRSLRVDRNRITRLPGSLEISSPRHLAVPPLYKRRRVAEADIQMPRDVCFHLFCFFSSGVCVFVELFLR